MSHLLLSIMMAVFLLTACADRQATPTAIEAPEAPSSAETSVAPGTPLPTAPASAAAGKQATGEHPRLWLTTADLPRLRAWANDSNPLYRDGLAVVLANATDAMDRGDVPDQDCGSREYEEYATEMYAELFAFASLVHPDAAARADYAARARTLLMTAITEAAKGPATQENYNCNGSRGYPPFRHPEFFTTDSNRARWHGEAFPLVVDWIYPSLSAADKAKIRTVFLRWSEEIKQSGYHHPEPVGLVNDPALLADRLQVRWAGNNYFTAHMRNLGLMALALDPADDPGQTLHAYLDQATGAWLYIFHHLSGTDSQGGLLPEGLEYSPQTASYAIQFLLALHTAGEDDPNRRGPQVVLSANPFWDDLVTSYLHGLSPATTILDSAPELGPVYQPAWYGDAQHYRLPDFIDAFGALGLYDQAVSNAPRLASLRWIETQTPAGGADRLLERVANPDDFRQAILYFLLFDPAAASAPDPRPALPTAFLAPGMNKLFSRTGWGADATWFIYSLSWNQIDHQQADGNHFEFYRDGEWLTKARLGYADIAEGIASTEFRNAVALANNRPPDRDDDDWRIDLWRRGSQWNYVASGDPTLLAHSTAAGYTYALGDATNLYNSENESAVDITHASRSIVWLKPDHIVVYDRAQSQTAGRFKRWWLQLPQPATVSGARATMQTTAGQQLFLTSLLPANATLSAVNTVEQHILDTAAGDDPMQTRLKVEAPGDPTSVRFLQVLQGADAGAGADTAVLIGSDDGTFAGAAVRGAAVLFPVNLGAPLSSLVFTAPASVTRFLITGLTPDAGYTVQTAPVAGGTRVTIGAGGAQHADTGGVLAIGFSASQAGAVAYLPMVR